MKKPLMQQVEVTLKLNLWLRADMEEEEIGGYVRKHLYHGFPHQVKAIQENKFLDILDIKEEREIYSPETRYFIGCIEERHGEQEYTHKVLFTSNNLDPHEGATHHLEHIAKTWHGDWDAEGEKDEDHHGCDREEEDGGWYFWAGEFHVKSSGRYLEIDRLTYDAIKEIM